MSIGDEAGLMTIQQKVGRSRRRQYLEIFLKGGDAPKGSEAPKWSDLPKDVKDEDILKADETLRALFLEIVMS